MAKREAEIKLDETDFYEKKMINKQKKLILEELEGGQLLDEVNIAKKERKKRRKRQRKLESLKNKRACIYIYDKIHQCTTHN